MITYSSYPAKCIHSAEVETGFEASPKIKVACECYLGNMLAKQVGKDNISGFLGHIEPLITDIEISIAFNSK